MLQWGRDQLIAELSSIPSSADGLCELQWGRDQLIAELLAGWTLRFTGRTASMGPRSIDRGIDLRRLEAAGSHRLQWGRDQLIAEF